MTTQRYIPEHIALLCPVLYVEIVGQPYFPADFVVTNMVYALNAITFSTPCTKMIEETASSEDDMFWNITLCSSLEVDRRFEGKDSASIFRVGQ